MLSLGDFKTDSSARLPGLWVQVTSLPVVAHPRRKRGDLVMLAVSQRDWVNPRYNYSDNRRQVICGKLIAKWFCQYPSVYIYYSLSSCLMVTYENKEKKKQKRKEE